MKRVVAALLISSVFVSTTNAAVPRKVGGAPKRAAVAKPDPVRNAIGAIVLNSVEKGASLYTACAKSEFKILALGLDGIKSKIRQEKGEFETAAEFETRKSELERTLNIDRDVIVCQRLRDNVDAPFSFDAERGVFKGSFDRNQNVWRDVKQLGAYVSKTRMGVRATIKSSLEFNYEVAFTPEAFEKVGCLKSSYGDFNYEVPVSRDDAPSLKALGYLVFVGRLASPFIEANDKPGSPTLDDPYDVYEHTLTVQIYPSRVAVVGPPLGKVHWECALLADG